MKHPVGQAYVSPDGRIERVNEALASFLGYSVKELEGMNFARITHPDYLSADSNMFDDLLEGKIRHYQMDKKYIPRIGHPKAARLDVFGIYHETGEKRGSIDHIFGVVRPIEDDGPNPGNVDIKSMLRDVKGQLMVEMREELSNDFKKKAGPGLLDIIQKNWKASLIIFACFSFFFLVVVSLITGNASVITQIIEAFK